MVLQSAAYLFLAGEEDFGGMDDTELRETSQAHKSNRNIYILLPAETERIKIEFNEILATVQHPKKFGSDASKDGRRASWMRL